MLLKILIALIVVIELIYLLICLALFKWQNRLIFLPTSIMEMTPAELGLPSEDVWLSVSDESGSSEKLHGWWLPNQSSTDVLLYLHGNGSNISGNLGIAQNFYRLGFSILLIDYRGYGLSEGKFPIEAKVYQDAQIAWNYLVEKRGIKPQQIFVYGHSLGGAIAIDLAVRQPQMAGLIVEGCFTSVKDMIAYYGGAYRFFPNRLLIHQRFDSLSKVPLLKMPLLFIHGSEDTIIPADMSEQLFAVAKTPKKLFIVPEAGHNDVSMIGGEEYLQAIEDFAELARSVTFTTDLSTNIKK